MLIRRALAGLAIYTPSFISILPNLSLTKGVLESSYKSNNPQQCKMATFSEFEADGPVAKRIASTIPYYPFKGIDRFYDIGGMLNDPEAFQMAVDVFVERYRAMGVDKFAGLDARGFILGPPIALALQKPFVMLRKKGKLPNAISGSEYRKEYTGDQAGGGDTLVIPVGMVKGGEKVVIIDDLIATGGTLKAAVELVKAVGGEVTECACMIELKALDGRGAVQREYPDVPIWSMISEDILTLEGQLDTPPST